MEYNSIESLLHSAFKEGDSLTVNLLDKTQKINVHASFNLDSQIESLCIVTNNVQYAPSIAEVFCIYNSEMAYLEGIKKVPPKVQISTPDWCYEFNFPNVTIIGRLDNVASSVAVMGDLQESYHTFPQSGWVRGMYAVLEKNNVELNHVRIYDGSNGPNYFMHNGQSGGLDITCMVTNLTNPDINEDEFPRFNRLLAILGENQPLSLCGNGKEYVLHNS